MAARHPPVGIAHLTVVPENFEEEPEPHESGERTADRVAGRPDA